MIWKKPRVEIILSDTDVEHMDLLGDWSWSGQGTEQWSGQTADWSGQHG